MDRIWAIEKYRSSIDSICEAAGGVGVGGLAGGGRGGPAGVEPCRRGAYVLESLDSLGETVGVGDVRWGVRVGVT